MTEIPFDIRDSIIRNDSVQGMHNLTFMYRLLLKQGHNFTWGNTVVSEFEKDDWNRGNMNYIENMELMCFCFLICITDFDVFLIFLVNMNLFSNISLKQNMRCATQENKLGRWKRKCLLILETMFMFRINLFNLTKFTFLDPACF